MIYAKDKKSRAGFRMSETTKTKLTDLEATYETNGSEVIRMLIEQKWNSLRGD